MLLWGRKRLVLKLVRLYSAVVPQLRWLFQGVLSGDPVGPSLGLPGGFPGRLSPGSEFSDRLWLWEGMWATLVQIAELDFSAVLQLWGVVMVVQFVSGVFR